MDRAQIADVCACFSESKNRMWYGRVHNSRRFAIVSVSAEEKKQVMKAGNWFKTESVNIYLTSTWRINVEQEETKRG